MKNVFSVEPLMRVLNLGRDIVVEGIRDFRQIFAFHRLMFDEVHYSGLDRPFGVKNRCDFLHVRVMAGAHAGERQTEPA